MLTVEVLKNHLPKNKRRNVTQSVVDKINKISGPDGEDFAEEYRNNFISYISVLKEGEYKITDYMNAVKYASCKLMEYDNIDAYKLTFPDRYDRIMDKFADYGDEARIRADKIAPYVSMYNKNKLVNQIMDQAMIAPSILNAGLYQQALNRQAHLMLNAKSELVQTQAANSLLVQLKPNEVSKVELDIGLKENDAITELRKVTQELAQQQRLSIGSGAATSKEIVESRVIEADIDE